MQKHGDGSGLDEAVAHRFLEVLHETLTVMAMRERLRKTGALSPSERPKLVPLTHYLLFKHEGVDWKVLVNTKGDNSAEIAEAQRLLDAVRLQAKIFDCIDGISFKVSAAFAEAERQAEIARRAEAYAREQEAPFKAAQEEVDAALAEVKAQEDYRNNRTEELKRKSTEGGNLES